MNKKAGVPAIVFTVILFIIVIGILFLIKKPINQETPTQTIDNGKACVSDVDCFDGQACTLDSCIDGFCKYNQVVMCYNGDGCCPENCNQANDNDCTK